MIHLSKINVVNIKQFSGHLEIELKVSIMSARFSSVRITRNLSNDKKKKKKKKKKANIMSGRRGAHIIC